MPPLPPSPEELESATLGRNPVEVPVAPQVRVLVHPPITTSPAHPDAPPPIGLPAEDADIELFEVAVRKRIVAAVMDPRSYQALLEGLAAADLKERRLWWQLITAIAGRGRAAEEAGPSVKIVMNQNVPAPPHEEGALKRGPTIEVTATPPRDDHADG